MKRPNFTRESVLSALYELYGDDYIFILDNFDNIKQNVTVCCKKHNVFFEKSIATLLYAKHENDYALCDICRKENKFFKKFNEISNGEYSILSEYINCKEPLLFKHSNGVCNCEFWTTPDSFTNAGRRCPECSKKDKIEAQRLTHEEFCNRVHILFDDEYTVLSQYQGYNNRISLLHNKCHKIITPFAGDVLQGKGCINCYGKRKWTTEQYKEKISELYQDEYTILGDYINNRTQVLTRHNLCGYEWDLCPCTLLKHRVCPVCNNSHGENEIVNFCVFNNIDYKTQYYFEDLKDVTYLRFDFYISNGVRFVLVEYDGIGHFQPTRYNDQMSYEEAVEAFHSLQYRDSLKNQYCKSHNIPLLRIPYTCENFISDLLIPFLKSELGLDVQAPNLYVLDQLKNPRMKLIEYINTLPNGIYPKYDLVQESCGDEKRYRAIWTNEVFKQYANKKHIINSANYIEINNSYTDYDKYIHYGINHNYNFPAFNFIKSTYQLPSGNYTKQEISYSRGINNYGNLEREFMKTYISDRHIRITHNRVIIQ